jgi:hypothetical protein
LGVLLVDLQGADAGRVIDSRVLEAARLLSVRLLEVEKFDINLNVMARDLLLIPLVNR